MSTQNECRRCGGCCLGGGPALHEEDLELFASGVLATGNLLTLRKGEPAFDQPAGKVAPLQEELVKLAFGPDGKACMHYQAESQGCAIYEHRPLECRLQACWDETPMRAAYDKGRITRHHLLPAESAAMEIATLHEEQCSFQDLAEAAAELHQQPSAAAEARVLELLERDAAIRSGLANRFEEPQMVLQGYCFFLFGRPMQQSLPYFGLKLVHDGRSRRILRWRSVRLPEGATLPPEGPEAEAGPGRT